MRLLLCLLLFPLLCIGQTAYEEAETLIAQKKFSEAETILIDFVKNNPKDLQGIELLGDAYGHQIKWDEAAKQYKKLVETKPKTANYHY